MNKYIVEFANGDSIIFESKYEHEDKALNEILSKRYFTYEGVIYNCFHVVKIGKVA